MTGDRWWAFAAAGLAGVDVNAFLPRECGRPSVGSAKGGSLSCARC